MPKRVKQVCMTMFALLACVPIMVQAECTQDHRPDKKGGILVERLVLSGPVRVSSSDLADIAAKFSGSCFQDNSTELGERIKDQFQQRGYFTATVKNVSVKASDPLAIPKPVAVEADVLEGPLYTISDVQFDGYHAFTPQSLKARLPLKPGDVFNTARVRSALEGLRTLYGSEGYLDFTAVPATQINSDATVSLRMAIIEGKQYRMGKLQITGEEAQAARLQVRWTLQEGAPFDTTYLQTFVKENEPLLPSMQQGDAVSIARNCRDATVAVAIVLEQTSRSRDNAKDIDCAEEAKR